MVGVSTIIAVCITLFISLLLPIIAYIIYGMKNKGKGIWSAWLLGVAGYFVFQGVIRFPILNLLSSNRWFEVFYYEHYILYCFILTLTAALFEVAGRYIAAKILSKRLTFESSVAAGMGHGGIEAILRSGIIYIYTLIHIFLINTESFAAAETLGINTSRLFARRDALINTDISTIYLAGYESILTMIVQTALSLVVCYFVWMKRDLLGIGICVAVQFLANFVALVIVRLVMGYVGKGLPLSIAYIAGYGFMTIIAIMSLRIIKKVKSKWKITV